MLSPAPRDIGALSKNSQRLPMIASRRSPTRQGWSGRCSMKRRRAIQAASLCPVRRCGAWKTLRRNDDKSLPTSHTVDFLFTLPADFRHRGISKVPGLLMKLNADERGTPLAGLSVKVTSGYFLIGLSARPGDTDRNIQLLKERPWLSVPIVYEDGKRAILVFAKGEAGTRALNEAFAAWGSTVSREKSAPPDQKNDRVPRRSPFPPEIIPIARQPSPVTSPVAPLRR